MSRRSRSDRLRRLESRPDLRRLQLVPQRHAGDVDQVAYHPPASIGGASSSGRMLAGDGMRAQHFGGRAADERVGVGQMARGRARRAAGVSSRPVDEHLHGCERAARGRRSAGTGQQGRVVESTAGVRGPRARGRAGGPVLPELMILRTAATQRPPPRSTSWLAAAIRTARLGWPRSAISSSTDDLRPIDRRRRRAALAVRSRGRRSARSGRARGRGRDG